MIFISCLIKTLIVVTTMASKQYGLVLLFVIFITQQTFAQKSVEEDLKNALQNLTHTVNAVINVTRNNIQKQIQDMVDFALDAAVSNEDLISGTLSANFGQIDYQYELANKYQVNVSSCNHGEKQQMMETANKATDKARTCMFNAMQNGQNAAYAGMTEIMKFQEFVDDLKKKAQNCHDADCSKTIMKKIDSTVGSLLLTSQIVLHNIARKILNVKNDIESCVETFITPALNKIPAIARDLVHCIHDLIDNNIHL